MTVERLCRHHSTATFDCKDAPQYNELLEEYKRQSELAVGPRVFVSLDREDHVTGYIAVCDLILSTPTASGRFFFYCALAMSTGSSGAFDLISLRGTANKLLDELERAGKRYVGEAAAPGTNRQLERFLDSDGFEPHEGGFFWLRARPSALVPS